MQSQFQSSSLPRTRQRRHALDRSEAGAPPIAVRVFIAYADLPAARSALTRVTALLRAGNRRWELHPLLWRFDQLDRAPWRTMALIDASRASAIVIAMNDDLPLSNSADAWLRNLAQQHRGARIAVNALWNDELWSISLEQSAGAAGISLPSAIAPKESPAAIASLPDKSLAARAA